MHLLNSLQQRITDLQKQDNHRQFKTVNPNLLNLSSNDYLGLASDLSLSERFLAISGADQLRFGASSSRLLTGNFDTHEALECKLAQHFGRSALIFNSGYHMNIGILPALCTDKTLILADKWIHASIIDGIRLSGVDYVRYRHQDMNQLSQIIEKHQQIQKYTYIIIATESIFSMDGDKTDLAKLVDIKRHYTTPTCTVSLYVDEAHAIGACGQTGLGVAQEQDVLGDIDFLVGTFGKALASVGGYLICEPVVKDFLINTMRPLIFSTALPPINTAWTAFIFDEMLKMTDKRQKLQQNSKYLIKNIKSLGFDCPSDSQIVPVIVKENARAVKYAHALQDAGFYVLPVRPPTVPKNSSRLRICLTSEIQKSELDKLLSVLDELRHGRDG